MRTDRLLHYGCGLLALSLLVTLGLSALSFGELDRADLLALALAQWLGQLALVGGIALLAGHVVVRSLTPPSLEDEIRDWYEDS